MTSIRELCESGTSRRYNDGLFFPALPMPGPFKWRIQDAIAVLKGEAVAVNEADHTSAPQSPFVR